MSCACVVRFVGLSVSVSLSLSLSPPPPPPPSPNHPQIILSHRLCSRFLRITPVRNLDDRSDTLGRSEAVEVSRVDVPEDAPLGLGPPPRPVLATVHKALVVAVKPHLLATAVHHGRRDAHLDSLLLQAGHRTRPGRRCPALACRREPLEDVGARLQRKVTVRHRVDVRDRAAAHQLVPLLLLKLLALTLQRPSLFLEVDG